MSDFAIFFNGVYSSVLDEILKIQEALPEQILFLQPHSGQLIRRLAESPPTTEAPVHAFISTSDRLQDVSYRTEIVGWEDKRSIAKEKKNVLNRLIWTLQPEETGLYERAKEDGPLCANLLHVRRTSRLAPSLRVSDLVNLESGSPLSEGRTTSGGWVYIAPPTIS